MSWKWKDPDMILKLCRKVLGHAELSLLQHNLFMSLTTLYYLDSYCGRNRGAMNI